MEAALQVIAREYEIRPDMLDRLRVLRDFEIVIVCDDSGSMKTTVDGTQRTRWDELCHIVKIILKIAVIFDTNGVDIYFLNEERSFNVKNPAEVEHLFSKRPGGFTPLVSVLSRIFQLPPSLRGHDKKLLVFVATDGMPTDDKGNENIPELDNLMRQTRRAETTFVSFLICTDDPIYVNYLNGWDRTMKNVDVTDDFNTERNEVRKYHGANYPFSIGDYVVKAVLGAIDFKMDALNEPT